MAFLRGQNSVYNNAKILRKAKYSTLVSDSLEAALSEMGFLPYHISTIGCINLCQINSAIGTRIHVIQTMILTQKYLE